MFRSRHHKQNRIFAQKWPKNAIFLRKTLFLGPECSVVGLRTLFSGCWTQNKVFGKILEQIIKGFRAAITKKPHFLPKNGQKCHFLASNSVFGA